MPDLVHVVVHDPSQKLQPGYVIHQPREFEVLKLRGVVVLPVDADLVPPVAHAALDGFQIRQWGSGWIANKGSGERCCPMVLRVLPQRPYVHCVFRCQTREGLDAHGRIRLVGDSSQAGYLSAGLAHVLQPDLIENTEPDARGGWTLRGVSSINVIEQGLLAMSLYAVARNVRILWSAVSLTSHKVD